MRHILLRCCKDKTFTRQTRVYQGHSDLDLRPKKSNQVILESMWMFVLDIITFGRYWYITFTRTYGHLDLDSSTFNHLNLISSSLSPSEHLLEIPSWCLGDIFSTAHSDVDLWPPNSILFLCPSECLPQMFAHPWDIVFTRMGWMDQSEFIQI